MPLFGKPLLAHHVGRTRKASRLGGFVLATSETTSDDPVEEYCRTAGENCHRGPLDDVLARFHGAAQAYNADVIVRITGDCPLIDPELIDFAIETFLKADGELDHVSLDHRVYPRGLDVEVFSREALDAAYHEGHDPYHREHVTPFIYLNPERFSCKSISRPGDPFAGHHRWCVDEPADFELVRRIIEALYPQNPDFGWLDVLEYLNRHPELASINADVVQKPLPDHLKPITG